MATSNGSAYRPNPTTHPLAVGQTVGQTPRLYARKRIARGRAVRRFPYPCPTCGAAVLELSRARSAGVILACRRCRDVHRLPDLYGASA